MKLSAYSYFGIVLIVLLATAVPAFAAMPDMLTVALQGREKATYTINYTDGSKDTITMDLEVNLTFNPISPVLSGGRYISSRADVEGRIHVIVTAVQQIQGSTITVPFNKDINFLKAMGVPVHTEFSSTDGSVMSLSTDITDREDVGPEDLKPYHFEYSGSKQRAFVWIRLPRPFHYPEDYEVYDVGVTARLSGVQGELLGKVLASSARTPLPGASIRLDGTTTTTTDADGVFRVADLNAGSHQIQISQTGYDTLTTTASVRPYGTTQVEFLLNRQTDLLTGSLKFIDQPRPILPGQKRSAKLTLQNTSANQLNGFVQANVFLSARQDNSVVAQLAMPPPLWVVLAPGQTGVFDVGIDLPSADQLGPNHAGLNHLFVRLQPVVAFPQIPPGQDIFSCPPFWLGQITQVFTHGFGQDMDGSFGHLILLPGFMNDWTELQSKFDSLIHQAGHPMEGSVKSEIVTWNSSDGWVQALFYFVLKQVFEASGYKLAGVELEAFIHSEMLQAEVHARRAAQEVSSFVQSSASPTFSQNGYHVIHLLGHSRGAAVNAFAARLLTLQGYRLDQYTALDGYSKDWPPPSDMLADINIVEELTAATTLANVTRRVNYTVEDGLTRLDPVVDTLYVALEPFLRFMYFAFIGTGQYDPYSEDFKQILKTYLPDWKAPSRSGFINERITGIGGGGDDARSNHLNVIGIYAQSDVRAPGEQYIFENFIGERLNARTVAESSSSRQLSLQTPALRLRSESEFEVNVKFWDFQDGTFEELGATSGRISKMEFAASTNSLIRLGIAILQSPQQILSTKWNLRGAAALASQSSNSFVELTTTTNTSLGQVLILGSAAASIDFDLSIVATGLSNSLAVMFGTNVLQQISLTNASFSTRLSVPLQNHSGPGEVAFQLNGPTSTPATIQLDNLAIVYAQPKLIRVQTQPNGNMRFSVEGKAGSRYVVEASADLMNWSETVTLDNLTGTVDFVENSMTNPTRRFYRVKIK